MIFTLKILNALILLKYNGNYFIKKSALEIIRTMKLI